MPYSEEHRKPEVTFPARTETGTRRADHIAFVVGYVEERKYHVSARRNSINKHPKSQLTIPLTPLQSKPKLVSRDDATTQRKAFKQVLYFSFTLRRRVVA